MVNALTRWAAATSVCAVLISAAWCGGPTKSVLNLSQPKPVAISADAANMLVTDGAGRGLQLVDTISGKVTAVNDGATAGYGASLSADSILVAFKAIPYPGGPQSPAIYNTATGETTILATSNLAGTPAFSASGHIAYTVENELRVQVINGDITHTFDLGHHVNLVALSPDGSNVAYDNEDGQICVINVATGKSRTVTDGKALYYGPGFSPDGSKLLLKTVTGDVAVAKVKGDKVKKLGAGSDPAWLDNSTVAFTTKTILDGVGVIDSDLVAVSTSGKVKGILASADGDAVAAVNRSGVAFARVGQPGDVSLHASSSGTATVDVGLATRRNAWLAPVAVELEELPQSVQANAVVDTTEMMYLSDVPYIHQNNDTPDWWNGNWSCNATAALMAIQYYNILPPHPMTASWPTPHNSDYGWYIPNEYTFNGHTYDIRSRDPNNTWGKGGYGYITQNRWEDTKTHMAEYISYHGPSSAVDWSPTMVKARQETANNYPFVVLCSITSSGHYPLCIGYVKNQNTLIFNDPYGNKNTGQYPSPDGRMVRYDWPGYNNGYSNLVTVHCYIWARMGNPPSSNDTIVDNSSAGFTAPGSWSTGTSAVDKYGADYRFRSTEAITDAATWSFDVPAAGNYEIFAWWSQGTNRSTSAPYILPDNTTVSKNQQTGGGTWQSLGIKNLPAGTNQVKLSCWTTAGYVVIADAIRVVPQ